MRASISISQAPRHVCPVSCTSRTVPADVELVRTPSSPVIILTSSDLPAPVSPIISTLTPFSGRASCLANFVQQRTFGAASTASSVCVHAYIRKDREFARTRDNQSWSPIHPTRGRSRNSRKAVECMRASFRVDSRADQGKHGKHLSTHAALNPKP